jgi:hypothetical protein
MTNDASSRKRRMLHDLQLLSVCHRELRSSEYVAFLISNSRRRCVEHNYST